MKKFGFLVSMLLAIVLLVTACGPAAPVTEDNLYYVRVVPDGIDVYDEPVYEKYENYNEAKAYCDKYAQYGCIVCDSNKKCLYSPCGSEVGSEIVYQAKIVCDFIRDDNFVYGNAPVNPGIDFSAHIVSCDRLVDWVLYRVGFTDQPYENGKCVSGPWLTNWCIDQGFQRIESVDDLQAGDVMFVRPNSNGDPLHTFIYAGEGEGAYYRYDAGSDARIQSTQPSCEGISSFMYAYRAPSMPDESGVAYATEAPAAPTFNPEETYTEVFVDNFDGDLNWKPLNNISGMTTLMGELKYKCNGTDPYFEYDGEFNLSCDEVDTLRIRIKNGTYSSTIEVFFTTDTITEYSASASVSATMQFTNIKDMNGDVWEEIEIDLSSCRKWTGTLVKLRIDPATSSGDMRIDSISLGKKG